MAAREEFRSNEKELEQVEHDLLAVHVYLVREVAHMRKPPLASSKLGKSVSLPALAKTPTAGAGGGGGDVIAPASPANVRTSPTNAAASPSGSMPGVVALDPALQGISSPDLLKMATQRMGRAEEACNRSDAASLKLGEDCSRAIAHVADCMEKRTAELNSIRDSLRDQQDEADGAIAEMDRALKMMKREKEMRKPDAGAKVEKAEAILAQLKASREKLALDLRSKEKALKIDETCKNLAPHRVEAHRRRRKSDACTQPTETTMRPVTSP